MNKGKPGDLIALYVAGFNSGMITCCGVVILKFDVSCSQPAKEKGRNLTNL